MTLYRLFFAISIAFFLAISYYGYTSLFPPESDKIDKAEIRGRWYFNNYGPSCRDSYMEFLNDSDMVRKDGSVLVKNKYDLQYLTSGYAIVKDDFQVTGDKDCHGEPIGSIPEGRYKITRWILWKKGARLRFYINEERSGKYIELKKGA